MDIVRFFPHIHINFSFPHYLPPKKAILYVYTTVQTKSEKQIGRVKN